MANRADERRSVKDAGADHGWYFDDDGSLAAAARAPQVEEWLGMGYALVGLALGSSTWLGLSSRPKRVHQGAREIA